MIPLIQCESTNIPEAMKSVDVKKSRGDTLGDSFLPRESNINI